MHPLRANGQSTLHGDISEIDSICDAFESTWRSGKRPKVEEFLAQLHTSCSFTLLIELILLEYDLRQSAGESPAIEEYLERFPEHAAVLKSQLLQVQETAGMPPAAVNTSNDELVVELQPGEQLGRYQLLSLLGRGGFGEVWRVRDPVLNREVALKTLRPDRRVDPTLNQSLVREGQNLARLNHERIVRVLDAGMSGGRAFLVSEIKEGGTLQRRIKDGPPIDRKTAVRWVIDIAHALQAAHEQGFIHRDLKPGNILFDAKGNVCVADFGLAASEYDQLGEPSGMMGTWAYAPPEQVRGDSRLADPRSDLYSLGVILYHLLVGRLPYVAQTTEQYKQQILEREPRPLRSINPDIPAELEMICLSCLRKEIANRPASALELAESLEAWLQRSSQAEIDAAHVAGVEKRGRSRVLVPALVIIGIMGVSAAVAVPRWFINDRIAEGTSDLSARPLHWTDPDVVVWDVNNARLARHGFDTDHNRYEFEAFNPSLFKTGFCENDHLIIEATLRYHHQTGTVGVFWGHQPVEQDRNVEQCWCLQVGALNQGNPQLITVREYGIGWNAGRTKVQSDNYVAHFERLPSVNDTIQLRLEVDATSIRQITINGKVYLSEPLILPERDWSVLKGSAYGFAGHGGRFYVESFSAE